jgi:hypothetical protein
VKPEPDLARIERGIQIIWGNEGMSSTTTTPDNREKKEC